MPIVSVLWGLGMVAAVAISILWNSNMTYRLAHSSLEVARINATVEAAISRAVIALLDLRPEKRWKTDGTVQSFEFNGTRMKVSIQDDLGLIDLNQAEPVTLVGLLQSAGLDLHAATDLVDKILKWRGSTSSGHLDHASFYEDSGSVNTFRPRKGPLQSVDELLLVRNVTPTLFKRIEPALTVFSGRQFIDPRVAPREVLLTLPNMAPQQVDAAITSRATSQDGDNQYAGNQINLLRGRAFTVRAEFEKSKSIVLYEANIRLTDNPAKPFWTLNWRVK